MKSIRYWAGIPLLTLIVLALLIISEIYRLQFVNSGYDVYEIYNHMANDSVGYSHTLDGIIVFFGMPILSMATALYYPINREDCHPLRKTIVFSFLGIFVLFFLALSILNLFDSSIATFDSFIEELPFNAFISTVFAVVEIVGYSLGLLIAKKINTKRKGDGFPVRKCENR